MISKNMPVYIVTLLVAGILTLYFRSNPFINHHINKDYALLIVLVSLIPTISYLWQLRKPRRRAAPIPFLPLVGIAYAMYYGVPALTGDEFEIRFSVLPDECVNEALKLALIGWIMLLSGFYGSARIFSGIRPLQLHWKIKKAQTFAYIFIFTGLAMRVVKPVLNIGSMGQILEFIITLFDVGLGILIVLNMRNLLKPFSRVLLWFGLVPYFVVSSLGTGLTSSFILANLYIFMLVWACMKRLPWAAIALLIVVAVLIRGSIFEYREKIWYETTGPKKNSLEKTQILFDIITEKIESEGALSILSESSDTTSKRSSMLSTFAYVLQASPSQIPYWNGSTYNSLLSSFIPRVLWPNKPSKDLGQRFGHVYYFLDDKDTSTSVNLPQLVEFYVNFGPTGVIVGMFLLGLIYRVLYRKINHAEMGDGTVVIAALIFRNLMNIESDFSLVFGLIIQHIIIMSILFRIIREKHPHESSYGPEFHTVQRQSP